MRSAPTSFHLEAAVYAQDDLRLRPNLTFSPGLRYELQTHVHDLSGLGQRAHPQRAATLDPVRAIKAE